MRNVTDRLASPQLKVTQPSGSFTVTLTEEKVSLGRDPACDIRLNVPYISKRHAVLERVDAAYKYVQTGGTNPTFIDGRPVMERILEHGDVLTIGPEEGPAVTLTIAYSGAAPAPAPGTFGSEPTRRRLIAALEAEHRAAPVRTQIVVRELGGAFTVNLDKESLSFGRDESNDIRVKAGFVSRQHGRFDQVANTFKYVHLSTTNPTLFAGQPVVEKQLAAGDTLEIRGPDSKVTLTYATQEEPLAQPSQSVEPSAVPEQVVFRASLAGRDSLAIGRNPDSDIVLPSGHVSWRHARIKRSDGNYVLEDLHSTNGTFVNGSQITDHELESGDSIRIGAYRLSFADGEIQGYNEERAVRLDVDSIAKTIGALTILSGISLSVFPGEILAIAGTSGSGKSTLMDALNGVRPATSGRVTVNGVDAYHNFDAIKPLVGYVPQFSILHNELPLERALFYVGRLRFPDDVSDAEVWRRVREVLRTIQMEERAHVPVGRLSGGQQKRASIAGELLTEPGLFFLDEPTTGLDPGLTRKLMVVVRRLADEGRTIILVTHDTESLDLCDLMIFLASGRTVYLGPPREAKSYFGVESIADVYSRVEEEDSADAWEEAYRKSELHERYVERRSTDGEEPPLQRQQEPREAIPRTQKTGLSGWRQWQVLLRRSLELLLRDRLTLALIMLQAPILAILLDLIALPNGLTHLPGIDVPLTELKDLPRELTGLAIPALPLLMAASVTWVGSMNACREIVKEVAIFRRERIAGLKILPYVSSKVAVLAALSIVQVTIFFAIVAARVNVPSSGALMPGYIEIYLTLLLACFASTGLGLLISAVSPNPDRAQGIVPLVLIPQLLLARVGPDAPLPAQILGYTSIPRWALQAIGTTVGLPGSEFDHSAAHILALWAGLAVITVGLVLATGLLLARRRLG